MHRFFVDKKQINEDNIYIEGTDVKHMKDVLRLKINDNVEVSCEGTSYLCEINRIEKDNISLSIKEIWEGNAESKVEIILLQGLSKGNKMELIFQKGTEIGLKGFYPVATKRSVVKIKDINKEQSKVERWNTIVEEAAKQSKRDYIPKVEGIISFNEMLEMLRGKSNIIVPYEDEKVITIREGLRDLAHEPIYLIIGPEGGFEAEEVQSFKDIGARIVSLGPRILRTETAGLVAGTIILYEVGNLGVI
ncbi:16S rRNA (uracil(1498)-N(3))-methyltransferase [Tissierella creatinini]|nr:16S rRNA (uracil(1498)-N(3))-methyltransferase [Tissierella creatinini]TJX67205.1 16S rRNA (uracil(1498)-N(3))-methyltransferase [Soehngenia saccharolytica]